MVQVLQLMEYCFFKIGNFVLWHPPCGTRCNTFDTGLISDYALNTLLHIGGTSSTTCGTNCELEDNAVFSPSSSPLGNTGTTEFTNRTTYYTVKITKLNTS